MTLQPESHEEMLPDSSTPVFYTIDQVATRFEITKRTLRYYEEVGLLPHTDRTEGNYRRYTEEDIDRITRIKELRDLLGFSLNDIRTLLEADDERSQIRQAVRQETEPAQKLTQFERACELILQQLELIDQKIAGLQSMHDALSNRYNRLQTRQREIRAQLTQEEQ